MKHHARCEPPTRVVILGAAGVIGKRLLPHLQDIPTLALTRTDLDLLQEESIPRLCSILQPTDALIVLAALTPRKGKGIRTFFDNILMCRHLCDVLQATPLAHIIYLSTDQVYRDTQVLLDEESSADSQTLYGAMHRTREVMLRTSTTAPLAILRPTMICAAEDTHNSYGPNRMRRQAAETNTITLFGNGEEQRDHISIFNVVELIRLVLLHKSTGVLNLASGQSISYCDLAQKITASFDHPIQILNTPRAHPIIHRHFDVTAIYKAFPSFCLQSLDEGLAQEHALEFQFVKQG